MKCLICGAEVFEKFHDGTRDNSEINVMKCLNCESLQLSSFEQISDGFYEDGNMNKNQWDDSDGAYSDEAWKSWIEETKRDDYRRVEMLSGILGSKRKILDFGCGNGGYLRKTRAKYSAETIVGVELDRGARSRLSEEGIEVYEKLEDMDDNAKFDVITMFHVIEHLKEPYKIIKKLKDKLVAGGVLVIETPNANDALISKYHSESFMKFTFWSAHLFLYNSYSLELLMKKCGFSIIKNEQIQRYSLGNHLYWLAENKPGGHMKWEEFNQELLNKSYMNILREMGQCDTLFGIFEVL